MLPRLRCLASRPMVCKLKNRWCEVYRGAWFNTSALRRWLVIGSHPWNAVQMCRSNVSSLAPKPIINATSERLNFIFCSESCSPWRGFVEPIQLPNRSFIPLSSSGTFSSPLKQLTAVACSRALLPVVVISDRNPLDCGDTVVAQIYSS